MAKPKPKAKSKPKPAASPAPLAEMRAASAALDRDDDPAALDALCAAWRIERSVRIAELAELVEQRLPIAEPDAAALRAGLRARAAPLLRPLIATVEHESAGEAAARLRKVAWPDPRLATILLELLAAPHWRSLPAVTCWQVCLDRIVESGDQRALAPLSELGERYTGVIPTSIGLLVQKKIRAAVEQLRARPAWSEPTGKLLALCDEVASKLSREILARDAARGRRISDVQARDELLAAIYAAPNDDGPRAVFADWLLERSDLRGELINLQLARARGVSDDVSRARELELLESRNAELWLGSLGAAVQDTDQIYARGFPGYVRLWKNKAAIPSVAGDRAWGTVETLVIDEWRAAGKPGQAAIVDIVAGPTRALTALVNFPAAVIRKLAERDALWRIERIEGIDNEREPDTLVAWLGDTTARRRGLSFAAYNLRPDRLGDLLAAPGFARLERLTLHEPTELAAWIVALARLGLPRLQLGVGDLFAELSLGDNTYDRVRIWRDVPGSWVASGRGTLDLDDNTSLAPIVGDRAVVIDTRVLHRPGNARGHRDLRASPTDAFVAEVRRLARSVEVETGWVDPLPDVVWT